MRLKLRSALPLFATVAAVLAVSTARAQEKPPLGPEVVAILGQPDGGAAALDADVVAVLGQPEGARPSEKLIDDSAAEIASKLRCPVCQGVSIADSPSGMATNMRAQVRELVAKGYGEEQIMSYFERSYGEFVRLEPPLRGLNVMLWVLPAIVLLGGASFVFWKARQPATAPATATPSSPTTAPAEGVDPALAKYLERIRRDSGTSS
jgi:cytochrome c-type biogenesis protein CcmH